MYRQATMQHVKGLVDVHDAAQDGRNTVATIVATIDAEDPALAAAVIEWADVDSRLVDVQRKCEDAIRSITTQMQDEPEGQLQSMGGIGELGPGQGAGHP